MRHFEMSHHPGCFDLAEPPRLLALLQNSRKCAFGRGVSDGSEAARRGYRGGADAREAVGPPGVAEDRAGAIQPGPIGGAVAGPWQGFEVDPMRVGQHPIQGCIQDHAL
jgi:hypothetical protein